METLEVKPRFRFRHRMAGRYFWEPLNDEARAALTAPSSSTPVAWFWGPGTSGLDVTVRAYDRAGELGMTLDQYREHVRALATKAREEREEREDFWRPITAEEMAELIPEGSWPAGLQRLAYDVYLEPLPLPIASLPHADEFVWPTAAPVPASAAVKLTERAPAVRTLGRRFLGLLAAGTLLALALTGCDNVYTDGGGYGGGWGGGGGVVIVHNHAPSIIVHHYAPPPRVRVYTSRRR